MNGAAKLVFVSGRLQGSEFELHEATVTVGRHPKQDLVLPEDVVSRHQATIRHDDGRYILRDEGSTNGTFVNDRKVREQVLQPGDLIEFGLDGPVARFDADPAVGVTRTVRRPGVEDRAAAVAHRQLRCLDCGRSFAVPARELVSASAVFVVLDESRIPDACPACGNAVDRSRLGEMLGQSA